MSLWQRLKRLTGFAQDDDRPTSGDPIELARESLGELLADKRLPEDIRATLGRDYAEVQAMLDKLEHGHIHITVFGRVSTGKSSLLNALTGEKHFATSPLHGETRHSSMRALDEKAVAGVFVIDTPGIDEAFDEGREAEARELAERSDLILFVADADLTATEFNALRALAASGRPLILVLNKKDRYTDDELATLLSSMAERTRAILDPENIVSAAADPRPLNVLTRFADGSEAMSTREVAVDVTDLKLRLWDVIEREGKTLAALNASLFAADLSDKVGQRVLDARREIAEDLVRTYCIAKGLAVAVNPLPVADLFAAAFVDGGMIVHLSIVYGLPVTRNEAGSLVRIIVTQAAALMGTVWAVHFVSSALKMGTGGLSTIVTAGAQGAVAYYSTYVVGQAASTYLAAGKSWGAAGPKQVITDILANLDRESILKQARREIREKIGGGK